MNDVEITAYYDHLCVNYCCSQSLPVSASLWQSLLHLTWVATLRRASCPVSFKVKDIMGWSSWILQQRQAFHTSV